MPGVQLEVSDVDTAPEDLFFELVESPRHGVLLKNLTRVHDHLRAGELHRSLSQRMDYRENN